MLTFINIYMALFNYHMKTFYRYSQMRKEKTEVERLSGPVQGKTQTRVYLSLTRPTFLTTAKLPHTVEAFNLRKGILKDEPTA